MTPLKQLVHPKRPGSALLISMIFIIVFSALAVSMATLSGTNVQIASNQHKVNVALTAAQSGLEVVRYYLSGMSIPGSVAPANRINTVANKLRDNLAAAGLTNITVNYNAATKTAAISNWLLNTQSDQSFRATLGYGVDCDSLQLDVIGTSRELSRRIRTNFMFASVGNNVFNFGIATKGPLRTKGSIEVEGLNERIEASVYIESPNSLLALEMIGKSSIAGDVSIVNCLANTNIGNLSSIGGEKGIAAQKHVFIGVPSSEFPVPNTAGFEHYVQNTFIPGTTPTDNVTLQNIRIPANSNPSFSGNVILKGIIFIEPPNAIKFNGNTQIIGIIIANGSLDSTSSANKLEFLGTVDSHSISELPDHEFSELKKETGTFLLAPGFSVSFGGNFATINGVIAASGVNFFGNAGGTINGSVVNYAETPMELDGNTDLIFNRSGIDKNPVGFEPSKILTFQPSSYSEISL
jgi:Tfp pilus assembly protein PilX